MIGVLNSKRRRERQAAAWFALLSDDHVDFEAMERFDRWRDKPANDAAYRRLEDTLRKARKLRDDPAMAQARRDARQRAVAVPLRTRPVTPWLISGLALASVAGAFALSLTMGLPPTYSTAVGQQRETVLADGTRVRLDTDTQLRVRFERDTRDVELLRGRAYFAVAHDASRPFVVRAGEASVQALGTQFDVRRDNAGVQVVLSEGRVRVSDSDAPDKVWTLSPGQGLALDRGGARATVAPVNVAVRTSWRDGRLIFDDLPLSAAVTEINRYSPRKIALASNTSADIRVSGVFKTGDTEEFVTAITALYRLKSERRWDGATVLAPVMEPKG